ncbi:hydrogenase nickel incorporation protein HypB [Noviherbaspirillum sp.]|jgi:hydrogenase nickel incorporation protein HypB|uniref:hydrogenase nickel incorporation protein HypB n=1 Tax=Noviherbaspirillum sp. TaxID=1926288 RepID=UPI0025E05CB7|nr:hydrogenase nickel incorporation protein HypB [Noviherbaspirillum sp.]
MCVVCGCGNKGTGNAQDQSVETGLPYRQVQRPAGSLHHHPHGHHHGHQHDHEHDHEHEHDHVAVDAATGDLHFGHGPACVSIPGVSQSRTIKLEQDVLGKNNRFAAQNREHFAHHGILALNLVSSPGSGKTTLLCATIEAIRQHGNFPPVAVIEGDQQTSNDADRIRATGAPAIQINTGKGCHLDAQMVGNAFARLPLHAHDGHGGHEGQGGILFIENVGNLVCPAMWDLGEAAKVAILSVTEGEDKPLKYPDMFAAARLMILNKVDLLPYLRFDLDQCIAYARRVNPAIEVLQVSATNGQGMDAWLDWIAQERRVLAESL